jgi:hypothetical protein
MHCQAVKAHKDKRIIAPYGAPIPDWCPLVEIPTPHGRLADLDQMVEDYWDGNHMEIDEGDLKAISQYKVVIEAEGSET